MGTRTPRRLRQPRVGESEEKARNRKDERNEKRLAEFWVLNDLVIGGTLFEHGDIHMPTWTSPNGHHCNQIDYIIINGKYKRFLLHTRKMRGANANSDHQLLLARVKLKLCRAKREKRRERKPYNTAKFRDHAVKEWFHIEIQTKFDALANNEDDSHRTIEEGILWEYRCCSRRKEKDQVISYRNVKKFDRGNFRNGISQQDWSCNESQDPNLAWSNFF